MEKRYYPTIAISQQLIGTRLARTFDGFTPQNEIFSSICNID
ncbi:MAG: hypothetical protein ACJ74Z_11765 [Bryobacteraceae bacterium]